MTTLRIGKSYQSRLTRLLLACGAIGPLLFIIVFLIEGVTRPDYNPWRHFVSSLSQGKDGWMQITNFIVCGILVFCFSLGLRRVFPTGKGSRWAPILLGMFGICLIGAGIFVTDPVLGYPPGPAGGRTLQSTLHNLVSLIVFVSLSAACFVLARRFAGDPAWRGWAVYSRVIGVVNLVLFFTTSLVAGLVPGAPAGLIQRVTIIVGWSWISALAFRLLQANKIEE